MNWLKQKMNIGQIQMTIPILITLASTIVGSMLWITNIGATSKEADAELSERVAKLETTIINTDKNVAEIKEDLRDLKTFFKIK